MVQVRSFVVFLIVALVAVLPRVPSQSAAPDKDSPVSDSASSDSADSALQARVVRIGADRSALERRYAVPFSELRRRRFEAFFEQELAALDELDYESLSVAASVDWHALRSNLWHDLRELRDDAARELEVLQAYPCLDDLVDLFEARERVDPVDGRKDAARVDAFAAAVRASAADTERLRALSANLRLRAARSVDALRRTLEEWFRFRDGYDPDFTWWTKQPVLGATRALQGLAASLRATRATEVGDATLVGDPIGAEALTAALEHAWIPYSASELIAIARREFEVVTKLRMEAARALGFDDWREAQKRVKESFVEPGQQPALIRSLAEEAIAWIEARDLVTVPELAKETWRMTMLSPERQLVSPYFLGGEVIQVSYPTDAMEHEHKLMSLRGNNPHFSRATVQHELIPGHHLQQFMNARYNPHRRAFNTPFWIEGWCLWWELYLFDLGFPRSREDEIGMLFWRAHRCARIIFSLEFQLGNWSGDQCIDFLVQEVGHERRNATAEVRRSIGGAYGPLYQAAYLLGGMQFRALHEELCKRSDAAWSPKVFHDRILRENTLPIELLRALLRGEKLEKSARPRWRFAG